MAEPQPRKYMTRGRAKAEQDPIQNATRPLRPKSEKRKALSESSSNEALVPGDQLLPTKSRATRGRTAKKPATDATRTAESTGGLQTAPRRRAARNGAAANPKKYNGKGTAAAPRATKKVTFVSPKAEPEDKENTPPQETAPKEADADTGLSASLSALSVKPKRIPGSISKPKQPTSSLMGSVPSLSPLKTKPVRPVNLHKEDESMEDELAAESSPTLSTKPKRPIRPLGNRDGDLSLSTTKKPLEISASVLFGSPAKRPPSTQLKPPKMKDDDEPQMSSPAKRGLSSPARRPQVRSGLSSSQTYTTPKLSAQVRGAGSPLKFALPAVEEENDPFVDLPTQDDYSEDELSSPSKLPASVGRKLFVKPSGKNIQVQAAKEPTQETTLDATAKEPTPRKSGIFDAVSALDSKDLMAIENSHIFAEPRTKRDIQITSVPPTIEVSTTPPTPPSKSANDFLLSKAAGSLSTNDVDGDVMMEDMDNAGSSGPLPPSPTPKQPAQKKHRSPSEGGSSYGFFVDDDEDDEDEQQDENSENVPPPKVVNSLSEKLFGMELDMPRGVRGFGQELSLMLPSDQDPFSDPIVSIGIPIDPMLLAESDEPATGHKKTAPQKTFAPLKLPADEDEFDNQENEDPTIRVPPSLPERPSSPLKQETAQEPSPVDQSSKKRQSTGMMKHSPGVLAGAVVFVDVHTTDGANASQCFEELLRHLGARVVKAWNWNPCSPSNEKSTKVGITHVVFKDGSPRTLQKVKQTSGLVVCVGLGWVVACADRREWIHENEFLVDLEIVPRGGHRRRKSMEPKMAAAMMSAEQNQNAPPKTPLQQKSFMPQLFATEPSKKDGQSISDLREKLIHARRKSMQFAPKIGSPLARNWSVDE